MKNELIEKAGRVRKKAADAMYAFAGHRRALPLLIVFCFGCSVAVAAASGYKLFGLDIHIATYQFYLCDYSVGFCSRLLVGAIITHFTDAVSVELMNTVINSAVLFTLAAQACLAGWGMLKAMKTRRPWAVPFILLFVCCPLSVTENMRMPGILDVYILAIFLVWLLVYRTPAVYLLTPPICLICMAIHYEFLFTYLPPMLILLLYKAVFSEKKSSRLCAGTSFAVSSVVSASSFFWFVLFAQKHLRVTSDEFYYRMVERLDMDPARRSANIYQLRGTPIYKDYFDYYIFGEYEGKNYFENTGEFFSFLKNFTEHNFNREMFRTELAVFLPFFIVFCILWFRAMARVKGGMKRFFFFCCAAQSLVLIPEIIISTDIWRWVSAAFISQFCVFIMLYADEPFKEETVCS